MREVNAGTDAHLQAPCLRALGIIDYANAAFDTLLIIDEGLYQFHGLKSSHHCGLVPTLIQHSQVHCQMGIEAGRV